MNDGKYIDLQHGCRLNIWGTRRSWHVQLEETSAWDDHFIDLPENLKEAAKILRAAADALDAFDLKELPE